MYGLRESLLKFAIPGKKKKKAKSLNKLVWIKRKPSKNPVTGDTVKSLRQCRLDESAVTFEGKMNVFWKVSVEVKLVKWHFLLVLFFFWTFSNQFIAILSSSLATRQPEYYCVDLAKSVGGKKKKKETRFWHTSISCRASAGDAPASGKMRCLGTTAQFVLA